MREHRLRFIKEGRAKFISHLDLMRTMQRVFIRAGIRIRHTEGFNPHPDMTFALALSLGYESDYEILDFQLADKTPLEEIPGLLNRTMPEGVIVLEAHKAEKKLKELRWVEVTGVWQYAGPVTQQQLADIRALFAQNEIVIIRRTKRGEGPADIKPQIDSIAFSADGDKLLVSARVSAVEPALNPELLAAAVRQKLSQYTPEHTAWRRRRLVDTEGKDFR